MPEWRPARAVEIDKKLRDDFRKMLREYGVTSQETDPVLAVLFRSFAVQLEQVYKQAGEVVPAVLLDELMGGLGIPGRRSLPAQTVLRFSATEEALEIAEGVETIGQTAGGERLTFSLDHSIRVSAARLAAVLVYENGQVRTHGGNDLSEELEQARPSFEPTPVELGPCAALFLAFDLPPEEHLSSHGLFFELGAEAEAVAESLHRAVWCLLNGDGAVTFAGMMKSHPGRGGLRVLEWSAEPLSPPAGSHLMLSDTGFYGRRVFLLPPIPPERQFVASVPRGMRGPMRKLFPEAPEAVLYAPRAWLRIGITESTGHLSEDLVRIVPHCVSASNAELLNQTIQFESMGVSIPFQDSGGRPRRFMGVVSVRGENGEAYEPFVELRAPGRSGRYRVRTGRIELQPGVSERGVPDRYATVRLLLTDGSLGNAVPAAGIQGFARAQQSLALTLTNITTAAGGSDGEEIASARARFSQMLLSRNRLITAADLQAAVRCFDPRIKAITCEPRLVRTHTGLQRVVEIQVEIPKDSMELPDEETPLLQQELQAYLQQRSLLGVHVRVVVQWI